VTIAVPVRALIEGNGVSPAALLVELRATPFYLPPCVNTRQAGYPGRTRWTVFHVRFFRLGGDGA
jgi:hypothetical protein